MPNRLANETSPYLLQHSNNPVDWYPWGEEALNRARIENKPIFLSIGYSACHWCHVMADESFEDAQTAAILNRAFISIKVDREERPDIDSIYMSAVMAMTGSGGWPMSMFLTPEGRPFYGGTYFPPSPRYGLPSFQEVLLSIARTWKEANGEVYQVADNLTAQLQESTQGSQGGNLQAGTITGAAVELVRTFHAQNGTWGHAPLFPQPMSIEFLLLSATRGQSDCLSVAVQALEMMQRGGLYDVVGGGFHRYSTDDRWLVPHFEKMLYDNAQLALVYLHAALLTDRPDFRSTCENTLNFIQRELMDPEGGFTSSLDADSDGEEGKYYVWTEEELRSALPNSDDLELLRLVYPLPAGGNWEGSLILQRQAAWQELTAATNLTLKILLERLAAIHSRLYDFRAKRVRPATDDKVLTAWNAFTLLAFAEAARYFQRTDYLETARNNADFLLTALMRDGRLIRSWRAGQTGAPGFLEDYAALILALLSLYQSDPQPRWYTAALQLGQEMTAAFEDPQGGFFNTSNEHGQLILRPKDIQDNATPSGSALAAYALLQLSEFAFRSEWREQAEKLLSSMQEVVLQYPTAFGMWLQAMDFAVGPVREIAILHPSGDNQIDPYLQMLWNTYRPRTVTAVSSFPVPEDAPQLLKDRALLNETVTAYVCSGYVCDLPVNTLPAFQKQIDRDISLPEIPAAPD